MSSHLRDTNSEPNNDTLISQPAQSETHKYFVKVKSDLIVIQSDGFSIKLALCPYHVLCMKAQLAGNSSPSSAPEDIPNVIGSSPLSHDRLLTTGNLHHILRADVNRHTGPFNLGPLSADSEEYTPNSVQNSNIGFSEWYFYYTCRSDISRMPTLTSPMCTALPNLWTTNSRCDSNSQTSVIWLNFRPQSSQDVGLHAHIALPCINVHSTLGTQYNCKVELSNNRDQAFA